MIPAESDPQQELLRSIASSLKGIQHSLDLLAAAVEEVAESIEKAHEPEGDLGHHLVGSLKEIASALHKRNQQDRQSPFPNPQQKQNPLQHQSRRDERSERHQRPENRPPAQDRVRQEHDSQQPQGETPDNSSHPEEGHMVEQSTSPQHQHKAHPDRLVRPKRRRGKQGTKPQGAPPVSPELPPDQHPPISHES